MSSHQQLGIFLLFMVGVLAYLGIGSVIDDWLIKKYGMRASLFPLAYMAAPLVVAGVLLVAFG